MTTKTLTREEWLQKFTEASRPLFEELGSPLPEIVRCSVGFPSKGQRSNTIGECWSSESTEDGICEIFLRPSLQSDSRRIAGVLFHELCHAAAGHEAGHGPAFRKLAVGGGLEGKMTATTEGEKFYEWADKVIAKIGAFPGAALKEAKQAGGKKKQATRRVKVECDSCDWSFRTSQKNIDQMIIHNCLACGAGELNPV